MLYRIINHIKLAVQTKNSCIKIQINKNEMKLVKLFIHLNYIKYIYKPKKAKLYNNNYYYVVINSQNNLSNMKNLYRPSGVRTISYNELVKNTIKKKSIFILSTNKGLLTNFQAIKYKVGGILILNLFF